MPTTRPQSEKARPQRLDAAKETIREHEVIVLSMRDSIAFVEALLHPAPPNDALRRAFRRHQDLLGPIVDDAPMTNAQNWPVRD